MSESYETHFVKDYQPGSDARVELKNGRFLDVINGCYFESGVSVIVEGEKIKSMPGLPGEPSDIEPDFTIDLKGKTVLPGLFNTHCHTGMTIPTVVSGLRDMRLAKKYHEQQLAKNMAECLAHGITIIRDAWTEDLRRIRDLKGKIASGEMPGPRILQSIVVGPDGGYLSGKVSLGMRLLRVLAGAPIVDYERIESGVVVFPIDASEGQVRDAVDRAVDERGADFIKIGEQLENMINFKPDATIMTIDQLKALTDQARRRGLRSTIHHVSVESFRRAVESGVSSLAHVPFTSALTQADVKAFNAADCIIEPTLTVVYDVCWKIKGDPYHDHPEMDRLTQYRDKTYAALMDEYWILELRDSAKKTHDKITKGKLKILGIIDMSAMFKYYSSVVSQGTDNLRLLFEQGARMACGNDGGVPPCTLAMMGHELSMFDLVVNRDRDDTNFSGADAVRIATINSARALGMEERFGSIETGKIADLVIVDGDPLQDFHVVGSRVAALFMGGRLVVNNCGLETEPGPQGKS